jgi:N-acetylglucosaminyldiphosphoundecaprenol N-acetyl-beta-D-mannosaminyltransferase
MEAALKRSTPALPRKRPVLGVGISTTSYEEVVRVCEAWISQRRSWTDGGEPSQAISLSHFVCVVSVHGVITARDDRDFHNVLNNADIATPDGMPLVWALRSFGESAQQRVYGPNLMLHLCAMAARVGARVFLYGGRPDTLAALQTYLGKRFPELRICGVFSPPFRPLTPEEDKEIRNTIRQSGADLLFVGMSTPKQDHWMMAHQDIHPALVMVGVGAAFDFHAGRVPQAPSWVQRAGLEWLFRLMVEPGRLWKRYLLLTPRFLPLWGMQKLGLLKYPESHVSG